MSDNTQNRSQGSTFWDRVGVLPEEEQWKVQGLLAALLDTCDDLHDCWLHLPTSLQTMLQTEHPRFFDEYDAVVSLAIDLLELDFDEPWNPFIEGRNAGISMIPVRKGSKIPAVAWKDFQVEICSELQATEWGGNGHHYGVGVVTGEVSGRLMAIDIEAAFVPRIAELAQRMGAAGLKETFDSWVAGYCESTPRGGLHILVRLEGEGECPHNQQFAFDVDGKVLIETRGEGGYVLVAPTPGYQWRGKCSYDTIVYCTLEEWLRVEAVLRSFDFTEWTAAGPPALTVPTRSTVGFGDILRLEGDSWIEAALAELPPMETVIAGLGYLQVGVDKHGTLWARPGKNPREGHSCRVNLNGRLMMFSSSTPLPASQKTTYDVVDVVFCYTHGHLPSKEERVDWLIAQRPPAVRDAGAAGTVPVAALNLSPTYWGSRGYLAHIHQAALALRLSPDAMLAGVKCFYGATIPWNHRLPGDGTMDYAAIVVGLSGAGKSQAKHAAWRLLEACHHIDGVHFPVPIGSGEGMTDIFVDHDNNDRRYKNRGAGFYADEGKFLLDIGGRAGSTTIQAIKQMWSGELTGSVAATKERHRWLDPRAVRATLLVSTTPDIAAQFMRQDLTDEGLPQRICWAWAHYDHPDVAPPWPGPLDVHIWDHNRATEGPYEIDLEPELAALIDERRLAAAKGQVTDGLEGHATYTMLKSAGIHSHIDGRMTTTMADWGLAEQEWEVTRMVRRHVLDSSKTAALDRNIAIGQAKAHQKIAEDNLHLEDAVASLIRKLKNSKQPLNRDEIRTHLKSYRTRHKINHHEVIALTIDRGQIRQTGPNAYE